MKKLYFLTVCLLASFAALAQTTETFSGKVTIDLAGAGDITQGSPSANIKTTAMIPILVPKATKALRPSLAFILRKANLKIGRAHV